MLGPEILKDMEVKVKQVQHNLKVSQYRKKNYANLKITPQEFEIGDHLFVKLKPKKSSLIL